MIGEEARRAAAELVTRLRASATGVEALGGVDMGEALEQALFYAIRDEALGRGRSPRIPPFARLPVRLTRNVAAWAARARLPEPGARPILVLALAPSHVTLVRQTLEELRRRDGPPVVLLRAGFPLPDGAAGAVAGSALLRDALDGHSLRALQRHELALAGRIGRATAGWRDVTTERRLELGSFAGAQLSLLARYAAHLGSAVRSLRPRLLVTFDEHGRWSRLVPAVGAAHGVPTLDLPHAEAADPVAIGPLTYDRIAIYGPRAREVMERAGTDPSRLVEIGPLRFDSLIGRLADHRRLADGAGNGRRRVVFTSAPLTGTMTRELKADTARAAFAAAAAVAPCELVVKRHPAERRQDGVIEAVLAESPLPAGVSVRITDGDLHELLLDTWLLVTGPSQSVFEAVIAGVPAITINASGGEDTVSFAREGVALGARDPATAADAARRMLIDPDREAAVRSAATRLQGRFGALDGMAHVRAADLILQLTDRTREG